MVSDRGRRTCWNSLSDPPNKFDLHARAVDLCGYPVSPPVNGILYRLRDHLRSVDRLEPVSLCLLDWRGGTVPDPYLSFHTRDFYVGPSRPDSQSQPRFVGEFPGSSVRGGRNRDLAAVDRAPPFESDSRRGPVVYPFARRSRGSADKLFLLAVLGWRGKLWIALLGGDDADPRLLSQFPSSAPVSSYHRDCFRALRRARRFQSTYGDHRRSRGVRGLGERALWNQ